MHQPYPQGPSTPHAHSHPQYPHNGTYSPAPYPPPPRMMNGSPGPVYYHQAHSPTTYSYAPPQHPPPPQYASPHTPPPPQMAGSYHPHPHTHSHAPPHAHPPHAHYPHPQHRFVNGQPQYLTRHHPASGRFPPTPPSVQSLSPAFSKPIHLPGHSSPGLQPTAPVFQPQHLMHPSIPSPLLHQPAPPSKAIQIVKPPSPTPPPKIATPPPPPEPEKIEPEVTPTSAPQSLPSTAQLSPQPSPVPSETSLPQTPQQQQPVPTSPSVEDSQLPDSATYGLSLWPVRPEEAMGLTISPLACPPPYILHSARPAPSSAAPRQAKAPRQRTQLRNPSRKTAVFSTVEDDLPTTKTSSSSSSGNKSTSLSTTDTTPTTSTAQTPTPSSPLSSNTSVSLPMTPVSLKRESVDHSPPELPSAGAETGIAPEPSTTPTPAPSTPIPEASKAELPAPAAEKPKTGPPPPLKKSFASLLRSSEPSSSTAGSVTSPSSSRTGFAASSQVGVSIPGSSTSTPLSPGSRPRTSLGLQDLLTAPSLPLESAPQIRPRGLVNTGNMCFANSVLQVLIYSPPFWKLFTELGGLIGAGPVAGAQRDREGSRATPLTDATVTFLKEFVPPPTSGLLSPRAKSKLPMRDDQSLEEDENREPRDSFVPSYVYAAMREKKRFDSMQRGHQEDAEEFLGFYLDSLHEELLSMIASKPGPQPAKPPEEEIHEEAASVSSAGGDGWMEIGKKNRTIVTRTTKSVDSPITRIFTGKYRSVLRMPGGKDSATVEDMRPLQLDIQPPTVSTVEDALQHFTHPDIVQMPSANGAPPNEITKQAFIEALPPILILHLKRFIYDSDRGGAGKVGKRIGFGPELEIRNDIVAPARRTPHPPKYKLYGVVYHHGPSASGGHYTIDVLHPNPRGPERPGEGWIRIDDEVVTHLTPQDVFGKKAPPPGGVDDGMDRSAYLLFYRRVTPAAAAQASRI